MSYFLFVERELFKYKHKRKKVSYTVPYKEEKFSKLKCFLIIIIKSFFSFYNIFFYTQQAFIFHLLRDFVTFMIILSIFLFIVEYLADKF